MDNVFLYCEKGRLKGSDDLYCFRKPFRVFYKPWRSSQRSASSAAWQPEAALVMA